MTLSDIEDNIDVRRTFLRGFIAETTPFKKARKHILRTYDNFGTTPDGSFITLTGESGAGKTTAADEVIEELADRWKGTRIAIIDDEEVELRPADALPPTVGVVKRTDRGLIRPIVKVFVPPKAGQEDLARSVLFAIGFRAPRAYKYPELMAALHQHVHRQHLRLVIFDEVHHVYDGHKVDTAYTAVEIIKMMLKEARIQVVCIGLPLTESIAFQNRELPRHFRGNVSVDALTHAVGDKNSDYVKFLRSLNDILPNDARANLADPWMVERLRIASEGYVGLITNLVHAAAIITLEDDLGKIGREQFAEAYDDMLNVDEHENPFLMASCTEEKFAPIRKLIKARNEAVVKKAPAGSQTAQQTGSPSFKKRSAR